jgi:hypothetical protein
VEGSEGEAEHVCTEMVICKSEAWNRTSLKRKEIFLFIYVLLTFKKVIE